MTTPQTGILPDASSHALFLTLRIDWAAERARERLAEAAATLPELTRSLAASDPAAGLVSVLAFGAGAWDLLRPTARPARLQPFRAREQGSRKAPATPADVLLHLRGERRDLLFLLARRFRERLGDIAIPLEEVAGFRYLDGRDLTGFVDGTENPEGTERAEAALVGTEDPDFSGGSYVHLQRYVHDLARWERLDCATQEGIIGRTRAGDEELPDGVKPASAHIARVVIEDDGGELEILRHSMPYGDSSQSGLVFIAYARTPEHFERMLDRMIYADPDGHYDHLMDYTRAVTGCAFFAPAEGHLAGLGG
jgi:putative iron-dependent peroxidase